MLTLFFDKSVEFIKNTTLDTPEIYKRDKGRGGERGGRTEKAQLKTQEKHLKTTPTEKPVTQPPKGATTPQNSLQPGKETAKDTQPGRQYPCQFSNPPQW
jgi:hypothetical protein